MSMRPPSSRIDGDGGGGPRGGVDSSKVCKLVPQIQSLAVAGSVQFFISPSLS